MSQPTSTKVAHFHQKRKVRVRMQMNYIFKTYDNAGLFTKAVLQRAKSFLEVLHRANIVSPSHALAGVHLYRMGTHGSDFASYELFDS